MNRASHIGERQIQDCLAPNLPALRRLNTEENGYQTAARERPCWRLKMLGPFDVIISLYTSRKVLVCVVTRRNGLLFTFNNGPLPLYAAGFIGTESLQERCAAIGRQTMTSKGFSHTE